MISVTTKSTSTPDGAAKLVAQITTLVDSYMIWLGSVETSQDSDQAAIQGGRLCTDWACAMTGNTKVCQLDVAMKNTTDY